MSYAMLPLLLLIICHAADFRHYADAADIADFDFFRCCCLILFFFRHSAADAADDTPAFHCRCRFAIFSLLPCCRCYAMLLMLPC